MPDRALLTAALDSYRQHGCTDATHPVIAVVDFALPSGTPRMWLIDLRDASGINAPIYVAHGSGSVDAARTELAVRFGNIEGSNMSSLGAYTVAETYRGKHGRSMKVDGLDATDDRARPRLVAIHTSAKVKDDYVSPAKLAKDGKLGLSEGCFVVMASDYPMVEARLANGGFLYAGLSASR
ncbi:murein L,D-transpeptidase catalytic domain-containing protein [Sphingomonas sp.]|jgi:hypothetical protein|uniref:murein L,D-transpeptidase catalytic domain-containing protein n=1 Tax=Sphingomonas sp. TaxID=28214 RepID=UPI002E34F9F2|nr:murein L,D-transpeptidase catalytic domain family protein [Sphingomonas sp.]HEX4693392.1 murein L,D-transpeptidase catalytic domain family protein [Sphingomonas sp.]